MWILEKYDDITLKRGIANLGRSHRLPRVFNNFHKPMSVEYIFSIAGVFTVAQIMCAIHITWHHCLILGKSCQNGFVWRIAFGNLTVCY